MKQSLLFISLLIAFIRPYSQESLTKQHFLKKVDSCELYFNPSPNFYTDYVEQPLDSNSLKACTYDYAIYDSVNKIEIRWRADNLSVLFDTTFANKNSSAIKNPDMFFQLGFITLILNLSDHTAPMNKPTTLPRENVEHDFNTDMAMQWSSKSPEKRFAGTYRNLFVFSYFKKEVHAEVLIFYLFKNEKSLNPSTLFKLFNDTQRLLIFKKN